MVPYLPCHDGFRLIPAHLLRCLAGRHEVHMVALSEGTETDAQRDWARMHCQSMTIVDCRADGRGRLAGSGLSRAAIAAVRERVHNLRPDVLHLEGTVLAPLARLVPPGTRTVASVHDALSLR